MIGLVLQGGGARGSYQIGAYMALKKARIKFDGVTGTSIGAFNGALIAAGKEKELLNFWTKASIGDILGFSPMYTQKKVKKEYDFSFIKLATKNIWNILKTRGIPTKGMEQIIKEYLNPKDLKKSKIDFGLCTVRIHDLKPLYIFKEEMQLEKISDYILASCYLPCFKMEKKVDNHYYLDGGFYDNTPINMLIEKGYEKIYVIELNPLINRKQKIKKKVEIIKITPRRSLGGILNLDSNKIIENIKMGYFDALRVVKKLDGYDYCFKKRPNWLYHIMMHKINRKKREKIMTFFNAHTEKKAIIKAMEYIMQQEKIDYYQIYCPFKMLKKIQKETLKNHFVYEFVQELRIL